MDDVKKLRLSLWENGYRPVAVRTRSKKPFGENWLELAMNDPPWAVNAPVNEVALSTGIVCAGLRAIDIDIDDKEMADEIEKVAFEVFGETIVRFRSGSPRRLFLYKTRDADLRKRIIEFEIGHKVEILGHKQKFLSFGIHDEGMAYEWRDNTSPLDIPANQLTEISEHQIDTFTEICESLYPIINKKKPEPIVYENDGSVEEGRARQYALSVLEGVATDLASVKSGGRNNALNSACMRLGSMKARGWLHPKECYDALLCACKQNGLIKEDGANAFIQTYRSGWNAGIANPAKDPIDREPPCRDFRHTEIEPVIRENRITEIVPNIQLDDSLTHPPGLLGRLIDWIADSGPTGNRRLALGASLALMSMILGRNISTPTKGSLAMYVLSTYPTGGGKKHQEDAINSIVDKLGLGKHMGVCSFKSGAFIEEMIKTKPLCLSLQDEFGQILGQITDSRASIHVSEISACFRKLLGVNFGIYRTGGALSRESGEVYAPNFSLYGVSTNEELFESIRGKDISNGTINRFMLIDGGDVRTRNKISPGNRPDVNEPPPHLIQDLYMLYQIGAPTRGNLSGSWDKNFDIKPDIFEVRWKDKNASDAFEALEEKCICLMDEDKDFGKMYARTAFYAIKIATILACCEDTKNPRVSSEHLSWSAALALESSNRFYHEAKENMVDNLSYFELCKKIEQILRWDPTHMMQRRKLRDKVKNYCGKNALDFSNCLTAMEKDNVIEFGKDGKKQFIKLLS
jgi:hypothetical protein